MKRIICKKCGRLILEELEGGDFLTLRPKISPMTFQLRNHEGVTKIFCLNCMVDLLTNSIGELETKVEE